MKILICIVFAGGDADDQMYSPLTWFYHLELDSWTQGPGSTVEPGYNDHG